VDDDADLDAAVVKFTVEQKGAYEAAAHLHRLGARGADIRPTQERVRGVYLQSTERRFRSRGDGTWPPLQDSSRERKARAGVDPRPLRWTQALFESLTLQSGPDQINQADPTEMRFGTDVPYARFHDRGAGVPRRKLIELRPAEQKQIAGIVEKYVAKGET
jgi:phage gpG-like protein